MPSNRILSISVVGAAVIAAGLGGSKLSEVLDGPIYASRALGLAGAPGYEAAMTSSLGSNDHSWSLYHYVKRHYQGWTLYAADQQDLLFSKMYDMEYTGFRRSVVVAYDPLVDDAIVQDLLTLPHAEATVLRLGSVIVLSPPAGNDGAGVAVVLRASDGRRIITPVALLKVPPCCLP